jgi:hypothetical protein
VHEIQVKLSVKKEVARWRRELWNGRKKIIIITGVVDWRKCVGG